MAMNRPNVTQQKHITELQVVAPKAKNSKKLKKCAKVTKVYFVFLHEGKYYAASNFLLRVTEKSTGDNPVPLILCASPVTPVTPLPILQSTSPE